MKKRLLVTAFVVAALGASLITGCSCSSSETSTSSNQTTNQTTNQTNAAVNTADIKYVDGFYAADGQGKDFYIAFYEGGAGDLAYVNDGKDEVVAAYTVEKQNLDDGTEYLLVNVGNTKLGYYEEGANIFLIDNDGHVYNAARLTEDQIEKLHSIVTAGK